jgi:WD40 repeat protein
MASYGSDVILTGGYDGVVRLTDMNGNCEDYHGHQSRVWSVAALPNGLIAAAAADGRLLLWKKGYPVMISEMQFSAVPLSIAWSSAWRCIVLATSTGILNRITIDEYLDA